jgi:hypothetical protein
MIKKMGWSKIDWAVVGWAEIRLTAKGWTKWIGWRQAFCNGLDYDWMG